MDQDIDTQQDQNAAGVCSVQKNNVKCNYFSLTNMQLYSPLNGDLLSITDNVCVWLNQEDGVQFTSLSTDMQSSYFTCTR